MPRVQLISLLCNETEDYWGEDEPYITINGVRAWEGDLNDNQTADLRMVPQIEFNTTAEIRLYDSDWPDGDDYLGTAVAHSSTVGMGEQRAGLTKDDANYVLTFKVTDSPEETGPSMQVSGGSTTTTAPFQSVGSQKPTAPSQPVLTNKEKAVKFAEALRDQPIVINTNTKEIHKPGCEYAAKIHSENRVPKKGSMDGAATLGFVMDNYDGCYYCLNGMHYK